MEGRAPAQDNSNKPPPRPKWLPQGMDPVLEELPKWSLLAEVLDEIEGEILRMEGGSSCSSLFCVHI